MFKLITTLVTLPVRLTWAIISFNWAVTWAVFLTVGALNGVNL